MSIASRRVQSPLEAAGFSVEPYNPIQQLRQLSELTTRAFAPAHVPSLGFEPGLHSGHINAGFALIRDTSGQPEHIPFGVQLVRRRDSQRPIATYTIIPGDECLGQKGAIAAYGVLPTDQHYTRDCLAYLDNLIVEQGDDTRVIITLLLGHVVDQCLEAARRRRKPWKLALHVTKASFAQVALPPVGFAGGIHLVKSRFHGQGNLWVRTLDPGPQ